MRRAGLLDAMAASLMPFRQPADKDHSHSDRSEQSCRLLQGGESGEKCNLVENEPNGA